MDIVDFQQYKEDSEEPDSWGYMDFDGDIGVGSKYIDIELYSKNPDVIYINLLGEMEQVDRQGLAEFLWAAAYFLDSDQEWLKGKYVCLNKG